MPNKNRFYSALAKRELQSQGIYFFGNGGVERLAFGRYIWRNQLKTIARLPYFLAGLSVGVIVSLIF